MRAEPRAAARAIWTGTRRTFAGSRLGDAARDALVSCVLCFAVAHVVIRVVDGAIRRAPWPLDLFTLIEAQRLWPALASDASAPWWSLAFGTIVFATCFLVTVRRNRMTGIVGPDALQPRRPSATGRSMRAGAALNGHGEGGVRTRPVTFAPAKAVVGARVTGRVGTLILVAGLAVHMTALASISALVRDFPPVPDMLHAHLPYVDFGVPGELVYAAFLLTMLAVLFRNQPRTVPAILTALGLFYAVRGLFLFLLPIGAPPTAPPLSERFVFWPYAGHAYFPGGHTGMMTVLSLSVVSRTWRRAFLAVVLLFAFGTLLARTHYTADAFGGWLVGYAIVLWTRRRFGALAGGIAAGGEAPSPLAFRRHPRGA